MFPESCEIEFLELYENKFLDLWMLGFLAQQGLKRLKVWRSCSCEEIFVTSLFLTILGHVL